MIKKRLHNMWLTFMVEFRAVMNRPIYLAATLGVPIFITFFFLTLMADGTPADLPVAVVDMDHSKASRNIARTLNAFKNNEVVMQAKDFTEARKAMQQRKIYGIYVIPENFEKDLTGMRQPTVSFYTNNAFLISGSLLMSDMKTMSALSAGAASRQVLLARGASDELAAALLQPIKVDCHPLNNPSTNYPVYLAPLLLPGIYNILVMLLTVYALGMDVKTGRSRGLLRLNGGNIGAVLVCKLMPLGTLFCLVNIAMNAIMYGYLHFPCHCGIHMMNLYSCLTVMANMSIAAFFYGLIPIMRLSLSLASFWSVLSLTMSGFTFPTSAFPQAFAAWQYLFPMREYFLIYTAQALNGYPVTYSIPYICALLAFIFLPILTSGNIKRAYEGMEYTK